MMVYINYICRPITQQISSQRSITAGNETRQRCHCAEGDPDDRLIANIQGLLILTAEKPNFKHHKIYNIEC